MYSDWVAEDCSKKQVYTAHSTRGVHIRASKRGLFVIQIIQKANWNQICKKSAATKLENCEHFEHALNTLLQLANKVGNF